MKVVLAAILFVGIAVFAMCFNIIFRKKEFPNSDVGSNENMRKLGIRCMKDEEDIIGRTSGKNKAKCTGTHSDACEGCSFYELEKYSK